MPPAATDDTLVWLAGGEFTMGSDDHYPEEAPSHRVRVDGFWIAPHAVTNAEYAAFVEATGYVTVAERPLDPADFPGAPAENLVPGSLVFTPTPGPVDLRDHGQWWRWTPGASWKAPLGPGSSWEDVPDHPVVQVAHEDAEAYASWAGGALPTEAEWEYAARGGLDGAEFVWGDDDTQDTEPRANTWQGRFPYENTELDGWTRTAPVGSFEPNGYGLFDMAGNAWEWTTDWYRAEHTAPSCCAPDNPRGGSEDGSYDPRQPQFRIPRKVVKGGSHLCTVQYCFRYRPAARQPQMVDSGMSHLTFRLIRRPA